MLRVVCNPLCGLQVGVCELKNKCASSSLHPHQANAMLSEIGEAARAVLALAVGGIILLTLGPSLNQVSVINLTALGVIYVFGAIVLALILVYSVTQALAP